jgi:hypothetical protein
MLQVVNMEAEDFPATINVVHYVDTSDGCDKATGRCNGK